MEEDEASHGGRPFTPYVETVEALTARTGEQGACERFATEDVSVPSTETMRAALDCVDREIDAGRPVYVHCFGGIGRTGTWSAVAASRHRSSRRATTRGGPQRASAKEDAERALRRSPVTDEQADS